MVVKERRESGQEAPNSAKEPKYGVVGGIENRLTARIAESRDIIRMSGFFLP
jgi:hypothetical protein